MHWVSTVADHRLRLAAIVAAYGFVQGCQCKRSPPAGGSDAARTGSVTPADTTIVDVPSGDTAPVDLLVAPDAPLRDAPTIDGTVIADGNPPVNDATGQRVVGTGCRAWQQPRPEGHDWLYVGARSTAGTVLSSANDVAFYVRLASEPEPGSPANQDDPCGVSAFDKRTPQVVVLATAFGFTSYFQKFLPQSCTALDPCVVELPPDLSKDFYAKRPDGGVRVKRADEVDAKRAKEYAAAIGDDALARAKILKRKLGSELAKSANTTNVPATELAIAVTEAKLSKGKCDLKCLDDPRLDPELRDYFTDLRKPGFPDPFEIRTPPDRWKPPR